VLVIVLVLLILGRIWALESSMRMLGYQVSPLSRKQECLE
jgi:hypothetical protein